MTLTPSWSRFLILPRYSYARLFQSKFLIMFLVACFFYPLGCAGFIYLSHNLSFLKTFNVQVGNLLSINGKFFLTFCGFQGGMAYLLTAFVGPSLVSPDLTNNALPLYFCRPFSRTEYVVGKMSVLMFLLVVDHVGARADSVRDSSEPGRMGMDRGQSVDRRVDFSGPAGVDRDSVADRDGDVGVGEVEDRGGRADPGRVLRGRRIRRGDQCRHADQIRNADRPGADDRDSVGETVSRCESCTGVSVTDAWTSLGVACAICLWLLVKRVRAFEVVK